MAASRVPGPLGICADGGSGARPYGLAGYGHPPGPVGLTALPLLDLVVQPLDIRAPPIQATASPAERKLAWGGHKNVDADFKRRVVEIAAGLEVDPDYLMVAMAFESGESFSASVKNAAGSGAVGLIQFMPTTALGLGTTTEKLAAMTALQQLDFVETYFESYKSRLKSIDVYMVILWPAAVGKPGSYVLFDKDNKHSPKYYLQNKGLDTDKDGKVTKDEAAKVVRAKLDKGLKPEFVG